MDDKLLVPYIVYESSMSRLERTIKRLFILIVMLITCLVGSNIAWTVYVSQFDFIDYEQDGDGINNVNFGGQGDLSNVTESQSQEEEKR